MCRIPPGTSSPTCARIETWDLLTSRLGGSLSWEAGASATGCSDPPRTQRPVRFPLNQALPEHASRLTAHHGRPAPGSRSRLPPGQVAAVTVRPIARLFPLPPAPLTVGRAGRAWPVPCRWPYRRLGGCGLRDRPHRRLRPGRGAITSALGWRGGDPLTLTASAGVMVAPRPGRHDHHAGPGPTS